MGIPPQPGTVNGSCRRVGSMNMLVGVSGRHLVCFGCTVQSKRGAAF